MNTSDKSEDLIAACKLINDAVERHSKDLPDVNFSCHFEFPGYVDICAAGVNFAFGFMNGEFGFDYEVMDDKGETGAYRTAGEACLVLDASKEELANFMVEQVASVLNQLDESITPEAANEAIDRWSEASADAEQEGLEKLIQNEAVVHSSNGVIRIDAQTGVVHSMNLYEDADRPDLMTSIFQFDLDEYFKYYGDQVRGEVRDFDILDLAFYRVSERGQQEWVEAVAEHREIVAEYRAKASGMTAEESNTPGFDGMDFPPRPPAKPSWWKRFKKYMKGLASIVVSACTTPKGQ